MGQGGKMMLVNKTPNRWKKTYQHSYQMNAWDDSFPAYIEAGQVVSVYVEWNQAGTESDDAGEIRYEIEGTGSIFEVRARAKNGFDLQVYLSNFPTQNYSSRSTIRLGWQHDGVVIFALAGAGSPWYSYGSNQSAAEWMSFVDDDTLLTDLTIPGTHDTATYRIEEGVIDKLSAQVLDALFNNLPGVLRNFAEGLGYGLKQIIANSAQCQTLDLNGQLAAGIRFFDIRLNNVNNQLMAYHAAVPLLVSLDELLAHCYGFLKLNPTESIIMSIKCEDGTPISGLVENAINAKSDYWFIENRIPMMKEMRKKIVLFRRYDMATNESPIGIDASFWPDNTPFHHVNFAGIKFTVQDEYKIYLLGQLDHKFDNYVLPCLTEALDPSKKERLFLNFLSGSGGVFPSTLAVYNQFFTGTNVLMSRHMDGWSNKRLGIIPIDYPESPANGTLIHQLFLLNQFTRKPHTAVEKAAVAEEGEAIV
jgi:hypothetical protein